MSDVKPTKAVHKKSTRVVSSEMYVTDSSKKSNMISLSSSGPKTVTNDREDGSPLFKSKHVKTSSCGGSDVHSSSADEGCSVPSSNSGLPVKSNVVPSLPQTAIVMA